MTKLSLLWLTDPHFNFLKQDDATFRFMQYLVKENPDADGLVITGDISSGEMIETHLKQISQGFSGPIYIITGNHDYYHSSFKEVDKMVAEVTKEYPNLHWLQNGNIYLPSFSIVGAGGWYDARVGNTKTNVELSDFTAIEDLWCGINYRDLIIDKVRKRADKEAEQLDKNLFTEITDTDADTVLVATHVSPFPNSCWHEGKLSDRDWLPWFCSIATGNVLDKYAESFPEKKYVVLCGHSHSSGIYTRSKNLVIYSGGARYYYPELAGKIDMEKMTITARDSNSKWQTLTL